MKTDKKNTTDFTEYCRQFYNTSFIPISCYDASGQVLCCFPTDVPELPSIHHTQRLLFENSRNPEYHATSSFAFFGCVRAENSGIHFLVGPVFSTPVNDRTLRDFMHECAISPVKRDLFASFMSTIPLFSTNQWYYLLASLYFTLNHRLLDVETHFHLTDICAGNQIDSAHSDSVVAAKEQSSFHNSYQFELQMLSCVEEGAPERLKQCLFSSAPTIKAGIIGDTALRQSKNIFIASATLVTRAAIRGGLDVEQAYQLSDIYINQSEAMSVIRDIETLSNSMLLDFAQRVAAIKLPKDMSREVFEAIQFISRNTNAPIGVQDVADHVNLSRSTISRRFKDELGFDISRFIQRARLEEARSLLTYSDKTLSEISSYLCFASQSHFQAVFKKKYGMTPTEYRKGGKTPH